MRAAVYDAFQGPVTVRQVADPVPDPSGVVIRVMACGICRSDWHGWMGNDKDIKLPHVPGHEIAGIVEETGRDVSRWRKGDRVTFPFVCGCGSCPQCETGNHQVCDRQFQPGFTHWGGFAEYVAIGYADVNLVRVPDEVDFQTASSLGCRFATSFRAVVDQGKVQPGQWVAVFGCGGVGLSAIMIAVAYGAKVIAIDIDDKKLDFAKSIGAAIVLNTTGIKDIAEAIIDLTGGGAHLSIDALGHPDIVFSSISSLRKRGKHIQVGIMETGFHNTPIPIDKVIGRELEILGSHGMQAGRYDLMLEMIRDGKLEPEKLIGKTVSLQQAASELANMNSFTGVGVTVITEF